MMPDYSDGKFHLYEIKDAEKRYPVDKLKDLKMEIWYHELNVFDKLKIQLNQSDIEVTMKICIPQCKNINSLCVLKIGDSYHKVYNANHLTNKDGFAETELTLETYAESTEVIE